MAPLRIRTCRASRLVAGLLSIPLNSGKTLCVAWAIVLRLLISRPTTLLVSGMFLLLPTEESCVHIEQVLGVGKFSV